MLHPLDFRGKSLEEQYEILKPLNILPFHYRLLFHFSTFCYKVLNKIILPDLIQNLIPNLNIKNTRCKIKYIFTFPLSLKMKSGKRLSIYLLQLVNKIVRFSYYLEFVDFSQ